MKITEKSGLAFLALVVLAAGLYFVQSGEAYRGSRFEFSSIRNNSSASKQKTELKLSDVRSKNNNIHNNFSAEFRRYREELQAKWDSYLKSSKIERKSQGEEKVKEPEEETATDDMKEEKEETYPVSPIPEPAKNEPKEEPKTEPKEEPKDTEPSPAQGMLTFTFDDGWKSIYSNAIPMLEAAGYKSTQYIISGTLQGGYSNYMTLADIMDLRSRGHEIGSHSRSHAHLTQISQDSAWDEILGSKDELRSYQLGDPASFAYPYGEYNDQTKETVRASGYSNAVTVDDGYNTSQTDNYYLRRMTVASFTSIEQVKAWIDEAAAGNSWVILSLHRVENGNPDPYAITPAFFQEIIDYVSEKNMSVVTISEGLGRVKSEQ